jgi:hypothetical protein
LRLSRIGPLDVTTKHSKKRERYMTNELIQDAIALWVSDHPEVPYGEVSRVLGISAATISRICRARGWGRRLQGAGKNVTVTRVDLAKLDELEVE